MKNIICLVLTSAVLWGGPTAWAGDLSIDNPYYQTSFEKLACDANQNPPLNLPEVLQPRALSFEKVEVSITLDKARLVAHFTEAGVPCRYNAIFKIDKRKFHRTLNLEQSSVFSEESENSLRCETFRSELDQALAFTPYKIDHDYVGIQLSFWGPVSECPSGNLLAVFKRIRRR